MRFNTKNWSRNRKSARIYLIVNFISSAFLLACITFLRRAIRRKCGHATMGENYAVVSSSRRKWPNMNCEIFNWFRCWEPAVAFPIDRRECDCRTEFPGHPVGSLAVSRRRSKGNRHAVIGGSRSFRILGAGFVLKRGCVAICSMLQLGHWSCGQSLSNGNSSKVLFSHAKCLSHKEEEKFVIFYASWKSKIIFLKLYLYLRVVWVSQ